MHKERKVKRKIKQLGADKIHRRNIKWKKEVTKVEQS